MRDANPRVEVAETAAEELICEDADGIAEAEQRVIGPDGANAEQGRMEDGLEREG